MTAPRADTVRWRGDRRGPRARHVHLLEDLAVDSSVYCGWPGLLSSRSSYAVLSVCWLLCVRGAWILRSRVRIYPPSLAGPKKAILQSSLIARLSPRFFPGHARAGWLPSGGRAIPQGGVGGRSACSRGWRGGRPDTGQT